jgi:hypothetical protein
LAAFLQKAEAKQATAAKIEQIKNDTLLNSILCVVTPEMKINKLKNIIGRNVSREFQPALVTPWITSKRSPYIIIMKVEIGKKRFSQFFSFKCLGSTIIDSRIAVEKVTRAILNTLIEQKNDKGVMI